MLKRKFTAWFCVKRLCLRQVYTCKKLSNIASESKYEPQTANVVDNKRRDKTDEVSQDAKPFSNRPFLKNVFAGIYDTDLLIFPESLSKPEQAELENYVTKAEHYFATNASITNPSLLSELKDIGLVGHSTSQDYGGGNLKATQVLRLSEVAAANECISSLVFSHNSLGMKCINKFGTEELKEIYLPKLSSGEDYVSVCLTETGSGSDISTIETTAELSKDGNHYILNGDKTWVTNGDIANIFIVFAKTEVNVSRDKKEKKVSAMIVERSDGGVTSSAPYKTLGLPDLPTCGVKFENTKVPVGNVLGELGCGFQMATQVLYEDMFLKGGAWAGILKNLSKQLANHCIKRKQFGKSLKDFGLIQEKLANISMNIYAMESMSYVTAGLIDSCVQPDIFCESAAVKVFSSERLLNSLVDAIQILGSAGCEADSDVSKFLLSASTSSLAISTNEILRLYISLNCLQHAGLKLQDSVRKRRDPFNNVGYLFQESWKHLKIGGKTSSNLKLYDYVHPELTVCAEALGHRVNMLKQVVIKYWTSLFNNLHEEQFALKKFADVSINVYVVNSILARATRSKAIGLKNCDQEILLVQTLTSKLMKSIDNDLSALELGSHSNGDIQHQKIAEALVNNGGYAIEHPLTRNW